MKPICEVKMVGFLGPSYDRLPMVSNRICRTTSFLSAGTTRSRRSPTVASGCAGCLSFKLPRKGLDNRQPLLGRLRLDVALLCELLDHREPFVRSPATRLGQLDYGIRERGCTSDDFWEERCEHPIVQED